MMITNWRKSTRSDRPYDPIPTCVETGWSGEIVGYRDTKQAALPDAQRPVLLVGKDAARGFLRMITA